MRSVSKKTGVSKKAARDRQILGKARREDGGRPLSEGPRRPAKRAGIKRKPGHDDPITLKRGAIELIVNMLEGAKQSAIEGAIPAMYIDAGAAQAVEAYRKIRFVQADLRRALEGGAS